MNNHKKSSFDELIKYAEVFAKSGWFSSVTTPEQAMVKLIAAEELGFGYYAAMSGIHIIHGKPVLSSNLMAAMIKDSKKYDFQIVEHNEKICELEFFEDGKPKGVEKYTIAMAQRAQVGNLHKYPQNMLFARCISNGYKFYCPDLFFGVAVYTGDEFVDEGVIVGEDGEILGFDESAVKQNVSKTKQPAPPNNVARPKQSNLPDFDPPKATNKTKQPAPPKNPEPETVDHSEQSAEEFWKYYGGVIKKLGFTKSPESKEDFVGFLSWLLEDDISDPYTISPDHYPKIAGALGKGVSSAQARLAEYRQSQNDDEPEDVSDPEQSQADDSQGGEDNLNPSYQAFTDSIEDRDIPEKELLELFNTAWDALGSAGIPVTKRGYAVLTLTGIEDLSDLNSSHLHKVIDQALMVADDEDSATWLSLKYPSLDIIETDEAIGFDDVPSA